MSTVVTFECAASPRATITDNGGSLTCVIDQITDINPQRSVSAYERKLGIRSLFPPTVRSRNPRFLIDLATHAVDAAAEATTGETGGPSGIVMLRYRVAMAVRGALRELGLDY